MKVTPITAFAIAVMVFAFNVSSAMASGDPKACLKDWTSDECFDFADNKIEKLEGPDQVEDERDVADSGEESSTSEASTSDQ